MNAIQASVYRGLAWQSAGKILERIIRFMVNVVVARLLAPDDFGAFAAVLLPLAAVDAITYLASGPFIIHARKGSEARYIDTIFVVNVLRGIVLCLILLAVAPFFAWYFERPGLTALFMVAAIQPVLTGVESPGVHLLAKGLQFGRIAVIRVVSAVMGSLTGLIVALQDPSPWALLYGQLAGVGMSVVASWMLAPVIVRFSIDRAAFRELRMFAIQAAGTPLLIMLVLQAPALLLGRMVSLDALGIFSMCARLAELPVFLTLAVAGSVLIPAYSLLQQDRDRLRRGWLKAWAGIGFISAPIALLLAWMGDDLPGLVWGAEYVPTESLMPVLALCGFLSSMLAVTGPLFWGVGRPGIDRVIQSVRVLAVFAVGVSVTSQFGGAGMAWSLACGLLMALVIACPQALRIVGAGAGQLVLASIPAAASTAIIGLPLLMVDLLWTPSGFARIAVGIVIGGLFGLSTGIQALRKRPESSDSP